MCNYTTLIYTYTRVLYIIRNALLKLATSLCLWQTVTDKTATEGETSERWRRESFFPFFSILWFSGYSSNRIYAGRRNESVGVSRHDDLFPRCRSSGSRDWHRPLWCATSEPIWIAARTKRDPAMRTMNFWKNQRRKQFDGLQRRSTWPASCS